MKIYKKERLPDGQRHIYLFGKKIISYKKRPSKFHTLFDKRFDGLTDKQVKYCIEHQFKRRFGYLPNLDDPKTFNEKLQWLKLYHRNPLMTVCADKVAVRDFVAERIGSEYLIPCLGVWDNPDDIDFDKLPDKFVLKEIQKKIQKGISLVALCHIRKYEKIYQIQNGKLVISTEMPIQRWQLHTNLNCSTF